MNKLSAKQKITLKLLNLRISHLLSDKLFLSIKFYAYFGKSVNWLRPITFNEKIQWFKLYNRNPLYTKLVDKLAVRDYVAELIGEGYLIPLIHKWDNISDINFNCLPGKFALKCTHDSGSVIICTNKENMDIAKIKDNLSKHFKENYYWHGREWPYKNVKPRIIAEELLDEHIKDYKFYCFNGTPRYLYISQGLENHKTAKISFYDMELNKAPFGRSDYFPFLDQIEKPKQFELMKEIAVKLSRNIPFVRVDLYNVNEKIYFSELTFTPCSGFMPFDPPEYDEILGELINLAYKK